MKVNVAVIGVGNMGKNHARIYSQITSCNLVAVSDVNEDIGKKVANTNECRYYRDYKEMLDKEDINAVSVVVPTKFHKDIGLYCLEKGKNVLIEKPIAPTLEDAEELIAAAKKKDVKLAVGHVERFNPAVQKLKELIENGHIGNVTSVLARRVGLYPPQIQDADVMIDLAVHDIDVFNYLLNRLPVKVYINSGKAINNKRNDYANLLLKYNGTSGFIEVNWLTPMKIRILNVTGTKGYAELDYINQELFLYETRYRGENDEEKSLYKFSAYIKNAIAIDKVEPLYMELKSFVECVRQNREPTVTGQDGLNAIKVLLDNKLLEKVDY